MIQKEVFFCSAGKKAFEIARKVVASAVGLTSKLISVSSADQKFSDLL